MRQVRLIAPGLVVLLGMAGWAGPAGAQLTNTPPYVPAPATAAPAATAAPTGQPTPPPGGVVVRMNARMVAGFGGVSDSGRSR